MPKFEALLCHLLHKGAVLLRCDEQVALESPGELEQREPADRQGIWVSKCDGPCTPKFGYCAITPACLKHRLCMQGGACLEAGLKYRLDKSPASVQTATRDYEWLSLAAMCRWDRSKRCNWAHWRTGSRGEKRCHSLLFYLLQKVAFAFVTQGNWSGKSVKGCHAR